MGIRGGGGHFLRNITPPHEYILGECHNVSGGGGGGGGGVGGYS